MSEVSIQIPMERFIELKRAEEENKRLREALEDIAWTYEDVEEPRLSQIEMFEIARQALEVKHERN